MKCGDQKKRSLTDRSGGDSTIEKRKIDYRLDEMNDLAVLARMFPEDMAVYHERRERMKKKLSATVMTRNGGGAT